MLSVLQGRKTAITLCVLLLLLARARASADAAAASASICRLDMKGDGAGGLRDASLDCSGGTVTAAIDRAFFGKHANQFRGLKLGACNVAYTCALTLCGSAPVVIEDSLVEGVTYEGDLVCLASEQHATVSHSVFKDNTCMRGGVVHLFDSAFINVSKTNFTDNVGVGSDHPENVNRYCGGALSLENSVVAIVADS
jgi:hypothetical protein